VPSRDREQLHVESADQWRDWLAGNADRGEGVWLVTWKKATGRPAPSYEDLICQALAVGWIDSTAATLDDERAMLWFSPRKKGSGWSRSNKQRIARLQEQGRMHARGRQVVEAAQRDGSWSLLDDVEDLVVPADLAEALTARPGARRQWDAFAPSVRKQHLAWLVQARRPPTRAKRVQAIADVAAAGRRAQP
jgi:uncharacterized protein YdeI (YjbR/CyaY-like superfamily)